MEMLLLFNKLRLKLINIKLPAALLSKKTYLKMQQKVTREYSNTSLKKRLFFKAS